MRLSLRSRNLSKLEAKSPKTCQNSLTISWQRKIKRKLCLSKLKLPWRILLSTLNWWSFTLGRALENLLWLRVNPDQLTLYASRDAISPSWLSKTSKECYKRSSWKPKFRNKNFFTTFLSWKNGQEGIYKTSNTISRQKNIPEGHWFLKKAT